VESLTAGIINGNLMYAYLGKKISDISEQLMICASFIKETFGENKSEID
jgi:hypothetical protein